MTVEATTPRVLLAAGPQESAALRHLFASGLLGPWEVGEADSLLRARFALQHAPWDVLLVDEGLYLRERGGGFSWALPSRAWVLLLADLPPAELARAWIQGIHQWLPRRTALEHPAVLAGALGPAVRARQWRRQRQQTEADLRECRHQRDRMLDLLWKAVPLGDEGGWLTQRHVLERLQEEVIRSQRYGEPLSVALAEVRAADPEEPPGTLATWTEGRVARGKRRCDLAGPYGPHGFLLLMVQTPASGGLACCRRLQRLLEQGQALPQGLRGPLRASFGLASLSDTAVTGAGLLRSAEEHLGEARGEGHIVA